MDWKREQGDARCTHGSYPHGCGAGPSSAMQRHFGELAVLISLLDLCFGLVFRGHLCVRMNLEIKVAPAEHAEYIQSVWAEPHW